MNILKNIIKNKKNLYILAVIFVLTASFFYYKVSSGAKIIDVARGDIMEELAAQGEVVASDEINLAFERAGVVGDINLSTGDEVKAGDKIASLKSQELEAQLKAYDAEIEADKASLSQLLAGTRSEELGVYESQLALAQSELDGALKNFENVKIKADNDLDQDYQNALNIADSVLLTANIATDVLNSIYQSSNKFQPFFFIMDFNKKSDAEWQIIFTRDAFKKIKETYDSLKKDQSHANIDDAISNFKVNMEIIRVALNKTSEAFDSASVVSGTKSMDDYKSDIARARASLNSTQTDILNKEQAIAAQVIDNNAKVQAAQSLVDQKRAAVTEKENELALKKAQPRDVEVQAYESKIREAKAARALAAAKIADSDILAPAPGIIQKIYIQKGESADNNKKVVTMSPVSNFQVDVKVAKEDVSKIKMGDKAEVTFFDENGNSKKISGSVVNFDLKDQKIDGSDSLYNDVYIAMSEKNSWLSIGENASVVIEATVKRNALAIPKRALITDGGKTMVFLYEDGNKKEIEVSTGEESLDTIEITSGLYEGDRIVLP